MLPGKWKDCCIVTCEGTVNRFIHRNPLEPDHFSPQDFATERSRDDFQNLWLRPLCLKGGDPWIAQNDGGHDLMVARPCGEFPQFRILHEFPETYPASAGFIV